MKPEIKAKNVKEKSKKVPKRKGNSTLIIGIVAVILLAGIAYAVLSKDTTNPTESTKKPMTLKEVRAAIDAKYSKIGEGTNTAPVSDNYVPKLSPKVADKLPSYAYTNPMTLKAYKYATEHPEVLEQLACYCGCGGHSGHRFLRDCFINDDGTYNDHASFCDVCVGEAIMAQDFLPDGIPAVTGASTAPVTTSSTDLSVLSLSDNFKTLADGLNLTPAGVNRAYFINTKMLAGTEMEAQYVEGSVEPDAFYGKKIIGMYSADYSPTSWIELHDLGYDSTGDTALVARLEQGMKNIVNTRPLIYGHSQNVDNVLKLMRNPTSMITSYSTYKPLLDAVDYQNAAYALVITQQTRFSDINYLSLTPVDGKTEMVRAFNITDNKSIPAAFNKYASQTRGNILIIKVTGDLNTVHSEEDNINAAART